MYRKGYIQILKIARREGLKIPISDRPISDFDLVQLQKEKEEQKQASQAQASAAKNKRTSQVVDKSVSGMISSTFLDFKPGISNVGAALKNGKIPSSQTDSSIVINGDANSEKAAPEVDDSPGETNKAYTLDLESDGEYATPDGQDHTPGANAHVWL